MRQQGGKGREGGHKPAGHVRGPRALCYNSAVPAPCPTCRKATDCRALAKRVLLSSRAPQSYVPRKIEPGSPVIQYELNERKRPQNTQAAS